MDPAPSPLENPESNGYVDSKSDLETETPRPLDLPSPTTEYFLAAVYPATLLLASTFYLLSPSPATSESYFSKKGNLINVIFVKYGWFWTTFVFLMHVSRLRASSKAKALLRWLLATAWWIIVTQWFLGPPLMDRAFTLSGGVCETLHQVNQAGPDMLDMNKPQVWLTSADCKFHGGRWAGGHDLSGHVFLLTHASLFLWSEFLPVFRVEGIMGGGIESTAVLGLLAMWWWMLLMTGIYFHTWREKATGYLIGAVQWALLYVWALRNVPKARFALGVPGV
ncbi:inositol phospholipid synthesis and fat-storage-inducing TM-domain-containing protein [Sphaerosporella brunnea]|uniref:Acyl-coenzyme A diphosphatase SCS3 n=1 Tax=Sphaerosporella brunnea TaxID=1250544 RepID=A0A5J5EWU3_9PEZI|nr:inositol phospholipid synthesis and fat-storage-inducing TM-domain-containing protein [Sphaerosporella brunnea]